MRDSQNTTVAIVVNSDGRTIANSATFIRSHIEAISARFNVITLVGNPGSRRIYESGRDLQGQSVFHRGFRKAARLLTGKSVVEQDNALLARLFRQHKVGAVFCEYGMSGVGVLACCKVLDLPLIVHFHGYDAYRYDIIETYQSRYAEMFDYASTIIAVSKDMQKALADRYGNIHKILHSSCGANPRDIVDRTKSTQRKAQFVYLGRLTPKKDPLGVIECFSRAAEQLSGYRLAIIGDGELRVQCEQKVHNAGLSDRVTFYGTLEHEAALGIVAESSLFVMNSVTAESGDKEGTPVSLMEAMAAGLTPLGTRHGGIMDIIEDGVSGYLYDEHDYEALTQLMVKVARQKDRSKIEANAQRFALEHLDEAKKTAVINDTIRSAIAGQPGSIS
ncbi:MAG: glycosyltransferase family 4 protein [Saccharospirillum sp.]|nr:glycosyltransferase family 4 protein [Saccharospirillum sp.]